MGANAQTTVPTFVLGQVLTADQMNQSARTGVPVFAGTSERDAAFGGSGEKTLAEGQLCYLESTNVVQYYDGSNWATVGPTTPTAPGLELVVAQTIGSAVSSVTVTGAFSSTYENYKIIVSGGVASTGNSMILTLGATASGYYRFAIFGTYNAATVSGANTNGGTGWADVVYGTTNTLNGEFDLYSPNLAKNTHLHGRVSASGAGLAGIYVTQGGYLADTTQYTAFTLTTNTGTVTGGTIRVYGYKN